jgi:hypothetical protein
MTLQEELAQLKTENENSEPKKPWQRRTAADILATDYPPLSWVVEGVIPEGLSKIDGGPKIGKSWLALHLATAVSSGGVFMGCIPVDQREVLYLALEDGERRIKSRLLKQCGKGNDKFFVETAASWKGGIASLRAYLKEYPETGLVIIDTLFMFSPMQDTNKYADTYSPVSTIQQIATETEVPIVLIQHTRKGGNANRGEAWADEGMGSQGINGAVDTILLLQKQDGKNEGSLRIKGRDIEEKHFKIVFDTDLCLWRIIGEADIKPADTKARADLIAVLEKAGTEGMKTGDIGKTLGKTNNAVSNLLKALETSGRVYSAGFGKWVLSQFHEHSQMNIRESVNVATTGRFTDSHSLRENESVTVVQFPVQEEEELEIY